jgi:hypothetical protein
MSEHEELVGRIANLSGQVVGFRQETDLAARLIQSLREALADELALALSQLHAAPTWFNHELADTVLARYREARK